MADPSVADFLTAEANDEALRSAFAGVFMTYDVRLTPVNTISATPHGAQEAFRKSAGFFGRFEPWSSTGTAVGFERRRRNWYRHRRRRELNMVLAAVEPITRRKLSDEVFDRLRRMITTSEVRPGDAMPSERELMDRFGVGRPAIREAMQSLSNMGLLTISHGERARVCALTARSITNQVDVAAQIMLATSPSSLDHLKNARIFFERGMAREAASKASSEDIDRLKMLIGRQRKSLGDADLFIAADMEFHTAITNISGNPIFTAVSESMLGWLKRFHTEMLIWSGKENMTLAEHEAIVAMIESRDPDAAERAMADHLSRSAALYRHAA